MLYLEDYLELIEHLPQEFCDRLTHIREQDLEVHNSAVRLNEKNIAFFAEAKKQKPEQRQCDYEAILNDYENAIKYADGKVEIATEMQAILNKLAQRLDNELEKFKLELEADHAGITEELEKRSLELDTESYLGDSSQTATNGCSAAPLKPSVIKDRRRSEHKLNKYKHRHHPYQNNHDNGYHGRAKLSYHDEQQQHRPSSDPQRFHQVHHDHYSSGGKILQNGDTCRQMTSLSPTQSDAGYSYMSDPSSIASDSNGTDSGHYENNLKLGNNSGFKNVSNSSSTKRKINIDSSISLNSNLNQNNNINNSNNNNQHLVLSAALSSTSPQLNSGSSPMPLSYSWYPWCSSLANNSSQGNTALYNRDETKYCICRQISYGEMVACDNTECEIEWFHYDCVGITQPPKGKWFCPDCSRKMHGQQQSDTDKTQTQKKRGRKETKSVFNLVNNSMDTIRARDRSPEQSKSLA